MASCRRTLGEPKQNTGHWERQVTAVGLRSAPIETPVGLHGLDDHHLGKVLARE